MTTTAHDVLAGRAAWSAECSDAAAWLATLPDDSIDLLFTSPPYEKARTYGRDDMVVGQAWVDWMVRVAAVAAPKVKGLMAIVCEGSTRNYLYSATPFLLVADLKRAGFNLRKPVVYHRVGIPGSGGPDWLRNDWEPVVCVTRPGRLPWSDPTACGHPPKYGAGGDLSYRLVDGRRKTRTVTRHRDGQGRYQNDKGYKVPVIANPGNVVRCKVGGGLMGHDLAHENEAPFPLKLAEFFVKTFCPPGGVCCDPFAGSGTVAHAAVLHGRRAVLCDVRESQIDLIGRRMAGMEVSDDRDAPDVGEGAGGTDEGPPGG